MAKFRGGRKNPNTIYLQIGDEPNDADLFWGVVIEAEHRDPTVAMLNVGLGDTEQAAKIMADMLRHYGMTTPAYPHKGAAVVLQKSDDG